MSKCRLTTLPFTVQVDTRERKPYSFTNITGDGNSRLIIPTERTVLLTGDYSIVGHHNSIAIERKSLRDLYGTLAGRRGAFERELDRMASLLVPVVIVEAELSEIKRNPPKHSTISGLNVYRTIISYTVRYPVRWLFLPDRRAAEITTIRLLQKYWKHHGPNKHASTNKRKGNQ